MSSSPKAHLEHYPGKPLTKGLYSPPKPTDIRSPCPFINSLANHGHLPRDGRNVTASQLLAGAKSIGGLSIVLAALLAHPIFLEHVPVAEGQDAKPPSFTTRVWKALHNPWSFFFSDKAMRRPGQNDGNGTPCLDLDQIALHGAVEHDVSLTRLDSGQGDNLSPQPELIKGVLEASSDGGKTLTIDDLAALRKRRIQKQREDNPDLTYTAREHRLGCGESALLLGVFGDRNGDSVRVDFAKAFFEEERLPIEEGWRKKGWFSSVGFRKVAGISKRIRASMGSY